MALDRFTRNYLAALIFVSVAGLGRWLSIWDFRVSQINIILSGDAELAAYPHHFKVISTENGVAEISSRRSADMPVIQFLGIVYPTFGSSRVMDDAVMAAQVSLAGSQSHAGTLISEMSDVDSIRWTIDRKCYASNGVHLD